VCVCVCVYKQGLGIPLTGLRAGLGPRAGAGNDSGFGTQVWFKMEPRVGSEYILRLEL
jgi:hypothetical protein